MYAFMDAAWILTSQTGRHPSRQSSRHKHSRPRQPVVRHIEGLQLGQGGDLKRESTGHTVLAEVNLHQAAGEQGTDGAEIVGHVADDLEVDGCLINVIPCSSRTVLIRYSDATHAWGRHTRQTDRK